MSKYETVAVVMDGSINGLGVVRSLGRDPQIRVVLVGEPNCAASVSRYVDDFKPARSDAEKLVALESVNAAHPQVVVFPCADKNYAFLIDHKAKLANFVIPWPDDGRQLMRKDVQLAVCEKAGITYPRSISVHDVDDFNARKPDDLQAPYMLKPDSAEDFQKDNGTLIFKVEQASSDDEARALVAKGAHAPSTILVSEYIPGGEENLVTYGGYAYQGKVLAAYTGYKLHHTPRTRVAAITCGLDIPDAAEPGDAAVAAFNYTGLFQVEFKRHAENGKLYYIEFNPRNWLWGYLATAEGNNLPLAKFYSEAGMPEKITPPPARDPNNVFYYVWEFGTLANMWKYKTLKPLRDLIGIMVSRKKRAVFALTEWGDLKPLWGFVRQSLSKKSSSR